MLPSKYRLPTIEIRDARRGKRFDHKGILIQVKPTTLPYPRFAFVVSIKVAKTAVARNRTKRLLSESVRLLLPHLKHGNDIIMTAIWPIDTISINSIQPIVKELFKKAKLLDG